MSWITANSDMLQVVLYAIMVLVWMVYLNAFLVTFMRQRRPDVLITTGAGTGLRARCFVTNLGLEPIYISDILVEIGYGGSNRRATITDRTEMSAEQLDNPQEATNQGPLPSAGLIDIGSFEQLAQRVRSKGVEASDEFESIEITTIALTASKSSMICSRRTYRIKEANGFKHPVPTTQGARQITSWWQQRKIRRQLAQNLAG